MSTQYVRMEGEPTSNRSKTYVMISCGLLFLVVIFTIAASATAEWGVVEFSIDNIPSSTVEASLHLGVWRICIDASINIPTKTQLSLSDCTSSDKYPFEGDKCSKYSDIDPLGMDVEGYCEKWKAEQAFTILAVFSSFVALTLSVVALVREKSRYAFSRASGHFAVITLFCFVIITAVWSKMAAPVRDFTGQICPFIENSVPGVCTLLGMSFTAKYNYSYFLAVVSMGLSGFAAILSYL